MREGIQHWLRMCIFIISGNYKYPIINLTNIQLFGNIEKKNKKKKKTAGLFICCCLFLLLLLFCLFAFVVVVISFIYLFIYSKFNSKFICEQELEFCCAGVTNLWSICGTLKHLIDTLNLFIFFFFC